jgi:hypothetical protein
MVFHIEEIAVNGSLDERFNPVINIARKSGNVLRSGLGDHQALEIHQEFSLLIRNQAVATTFGSGDSGSCTRPRDPMHDLLRNVEQYLLNEFHQ